jgi:3-hydroxyisobutyrate dehydrogenase
VIAGFIGLGSQGGPMARRIAEAGHPLVLWARRPATLEPFADLDVEISSTPAELGARCDVVGVCVVADADVEQVVLGPDGLLAGMRPGSTLVIHATIHPDTCRRLAAAAATTSVDVLDAPVSGGGQAAAERRLLVLVGGEASVLDRSLPILSTFGDPICHMGPVGAGQTAKLVNNALFAATLGVANEALRLGASLGVDERELAQSLEHGSARSMALGVAAGMRARLAAPDAGLHSMAALLTKDLDLVADLGASAGADVEPLREAAEHWLKLVAPDPPPGADEA